MKRIIFIILTLLFSTGCATTSTINELSGTYHENSDKFDTYRFAFKHKTDNYYFGSLYLREGDLKCYFFVGYKNDKLHYFFPAYHLYELKQTYNKNLSVEQKIENTLTKINKYKLANQKCTKKIATGQTTVSAKLRYAIEAAPYAALALMFFPVMLEPSIAAVKEHENIKNINTIKLGMSKKQIENILTKKLIIRKSELYTDYYLQFYNTRLVTYYKDDQLYAMVFGYHKSK